MTTRALFFALCLVLTASPAGAQVLRGTVMDTTVASPLDGVRVSAFSTAGGRIGDAVTKADGEFTFHLPAGGDYRLHASSLGYATTITEPIRVDSGAEASVVIHMVRLPLPLDTVTVVARPATEKQVRHLVDAGFYSRKQIGFGYFLTRADIDSRAAPVFAELLRGIPGVQVRCPGHAPCQVQMPGSTSMFIGKFCWPSVALDGILLSRGGSNMPPAYDVFDALGPFNLEAVEIYPHSSSVPMQWRTSACGAIVAWSRR